MNSLQEDKKIRELVSKIGVDFSTLSHATGQSKRDVFGWWNQPGIKILSPRHIENFAHYLSLTPEQIVSDQFDLNELRKKIILGPKIENEVYHLDAYSKVRTTAHIIKFLCFRFGQSKADQLLRHMGVHPCIYTLLDNKISIEFFTDLLSKIASLGLTEDEINHLSCYMFLTIEGTALGEKFSQAQNYFECYEIVNSSYDQFDHNFHYKMDLDQDGFKFYAYPGELLQKKIMERKINCTRLVFYRKTMLGWFPYLSGLAPLSVQLTKSIAFGDPFCLIEGSFPQQKKTSKPQKNKLRLLPDTNS
ncbi:MAG: hypothetical protein K1X29_08405 [Bdellovibrionales bacterium]|nr:hypothetical protein [Bdellovibrionales bacterium]